jgi:hypothetical protein
MLKLKNLGLMVILLALPLSQPSFAKDSAKAKAPTGAERERQYKEVVKSCQKQFSNGRTEVTAEWGTHYGRTGWWCGHRG